MHQKQDMHQKQEKHKKLLERKILRSRYYLAVRNKHCFFSFKLDGYGFHIHAVFPFVNVV